MPMHSPTRVQALARSANVRAAAAALLLFAAIVGFISSCGTDDLVFPGNIPSTFTPANTATPGPNNG